MSKNCVPNNGKIYKSNGTIEGKEYLWPTQGNQVYQSSLNVQVEIQVVGSLGCKDYLFRPDTKLVTTLKKVPRFEIGAMVDSDEEPKSNTKSVMTFIIPVKDKDQTLTSLEKVKELNDSLRQSITESEILPVYDKTGERTTFEQIRELKRKVSSYNQKIKQGAQGRLLEARVDRSSPEWIMKYGEIMQRNRLQVSAYSLRVNVKVRHYIFTEHSVANLDGVEPEQFDYYVGANRRYSKYRTYEVDIPLVSLEDLKTAKETVDKWVESIPDAINKELDGQEILYLVPKESMSDEQKKLDKKMSVAFEALLKENDNNNSVIKTTEDRADVDDILSLLDNISEDLDDDEEESDKDQS